jgi:hypothetical protein
MEHQQQLLGHDVKPFLPTLTTTGVSSAANNGIGNNGIEQSLQHHHNHSHPQQTLHPHHQQQQLLHNSSDLLAAGKPLADHFLVGGPGLARAASGSSATGSRPPTRPSSPLIHSNSRTPPPKRWKRSFDLARNEDSCGEEGAAAHHYANGSGSDYAADAEAKRFCEKRFSTDSERRFAEADSATRRFAEPRMINSYPHSMPASPTMLDSR